MVLAVTGEDHNTSSNSLRQTGRDDLTVIDVEVGSCSVIEANIKQGFLPDNVLYNIGLDAASTDLVCVSPSDVVFGLSDAAMFEGQFAMRKGIEKKKNREVEKQREYKGEGEDREEEGRREEEGEGEGEGEGEEQVEGSGGDHAPKAFIIPVYYARAHHRHENSSRSSDALGHQDGEEGVQSSQQERDSQSNIDTQSVRVSVSAAHNSPPIPFPSPTTPCGEQQSPKLLKAYIGTSDRSRLDGPEGLSRVPFNAQVLLPSPSSSFLLFFFSSSVFFFSIASTVSLLPIPSPC